MNFILLPLFLFSPIPYIYFSFPPLSVPLCLFLKQGLGFVLLPEIFLKSYITAGEFIGYRIKLPTRLS